MIPRRPFYGEYAWAFDLLIDRPVRRECGAIAGWLIECGIVPGATVLDAGCGTGRYAMELARRGYLVHGVDISPDLVEVARRRIDSPAGSVSFAVGDIVHVSSSSYAAILCRGVLNDITDDAARDGVMGAFARALPPGGALILDVREWEASRERKTREPVFRKRVSTERGELTFTSVTTIDPDGQRLLISERHELVTGGDARVSDHEFVMRCWTREEMDRLLARHGLRRAACFGAYDPGVPTGATDRLVVVARRRSG
jgi:SAM-dependent methyltransferase